tara:strand:+ start:608 stop:844 length:237 start_codon:yes stop_codon:yes gene_type:complete
MKEILKKMKMIGGILLLPIWIIFVIGDRIIVALLFWKESVSYRSYLKQHHMIMAYYRYIGIFALYGLAQLIKWMINGN